MNIFAKRPLFLSCMLFLACSCAGFFMNGTAKIIIVGLAVIALIFLLILALLRYYSREKKYCFVTLFLVTVMVILSFGRSYLHFNLKNDQISERYGHEYTVDAFVENVKYQGNSLSQYVISVININGEKDKHYAVLDCKFAAALQVGDKISVISTAQSPDRSGVKYNEMLELYSQNIFVVYSVESESDLKVHEYYSNTDNKFTFNKINHKLSNVLLQNIGNKEGKLCSALLLGNKDLLPATVQRDFRRAGASHVLALSGMHMSIIMGAAMLIIKRLTRKTWLISALLSVFAIIYLGITGFSISATRSVIMLLIVYLSMLISALPDSLTSLSIAGFLIVFVSPGAVLDASFWMSFSATLGILAFIPPLNDYFVEKAAKYDDKVKLKIHKAIYSIITAFATGLAALLPLIAVMCIFFKEISLFSILSSIVLSVPTAILIIGSLILIPLHSVPVISNVIIFILRITASLSINFCAWVSEIGGVVRSLNYPFATLMAVLLGGALIYSFASKHKNPIKSLIPFAICILLCICTMLVYEKTNKDNLKISYINASSNSDMLVLSNENEVVICDLSNGSASSYYLALDEVYKARATEIKAIMLTRYTNKHVATLYDLCESQRIRELWIPKPRNGDEYHMLERIYDIAKNNAVDVYLYNQGETLYSFGGVSIEHTYDYIDRSSVQISLIGIYTGHEHISYVSPSFNESNMNDLAQYHFSKSQYIIFGNRGPKTKTEYAVEDIDKVKFVAFADDTRAKYFLYPDFSFTKYYLVPEKIEFYVGK